MSSAENQIGLKALLRQLRSNFKLLLAVNVLVVTTAALAAFTQEPFYRATVTLIPVTKSSSVYSGGALSQLGTVAALAGISGQQDETVYGLAVLRSREFLRYVTANHFGIKKFEEIIGNPLEGERGELIAVDYILKDLLSITEERDTGLIYVSMDWVDPELAATWTNLLIDELNSRLREEAIDQAGQKIEYLVSQLSKSSQQEVKERIYPLLAENLNVAMLADSRKDYAFYVIDKAIAPAVGNPVRPRKVIILLLGILLGMVMSCFIIVVRFHRETA